MESLVIKSDNTDEWAIISNSYTSEILGSYISLKEAYDNNFSYKEHILVHIHTRNLNNIGSPVQSEITGVYGSPNSIYWNAYVTTDNLNSGGYYIDYIVASAKIFSPILL